LKKGAGEREKKVGGAAELGAMVPLGDAERTL